MRTILKHALWGTLLAGGVTLLGTTAASAAETDGENGLLSGTQVIAPISAPISVVGNAISILGTSTSSSSSTPAEPSSTTQPASAETSGSDGVGSGTQAVITIHAPIQVTGLAVAILGSSSSASSPASASAPETVATPTVSTSGAQGVLSGTQALIGVEAPVTVSGNAISLLGTSEVTPSGSGATAQPASSTDASTNGSGTIAGGSQVIAPASFPVTVTGNALSVLGTSTAQGGGGEAPAQAGPSGGILTTGQGGLLGGTQLVVPLSAPITIGGNAIAVLGDSTVSGPGSGEEPGGPGGTDPGGVDEPEPGEEPPPGASAATSGALASTGSALAATPLMAIALLLGLGVIALLLGRRRAA